MSSQDTPTRDVVKALRRPLALTRLGMLAENIVRAFWPLWSVVFLAMALLMLGLQDFVRIEVVWVTGAVLAVAAIAALFRGMSRVFLPSKAAALAQLDATLPGNPIQAALDSQASGVQDAESSALWQAHQARMRARLKEAKTVIPDLSVAKADPYALRYVALLALFVALLFGSVWRVQSVAAMGPVGGDVAAGPSWEGWVEPPTYTRLPSIYLNDITEPELTVVQGSRITLRIYGSPGALTINETVSDTPLAQEDSTALAFDVQRSGDLSLDGPGGQNWAVRVLDDMPPSVTRSGEVEVSYEGDASIPFDAEDDFGVVAGTARITLDLAAIERRYGLRVAPESRPDIDVPLPMPIAGSRAKFSETLIDNFSEHAWANLPVRFEYQVQDAAGQDSLIFQEAMVLPARRFFEPMAAAVIEQRQALLWSRENASDVALILRAISFEPDEIFRSAGQYLRLKAIIGNLEDYEKVGLTETQQDELAKALWDLAVILEEGDLEDARERLARAQDRLNEAMKNGASDQEIAELMQELRRATDDYMRQLSRQAQQQAEQNPDDQMAQDNQNSMEMSQDDLQRMMDRIQELMEQGRMAEAQEALQQLQQMMENMQVTQGEGQGQQSPGEQAMEGLAETLREQQGLSDEAFRDLQEQFNPNAQQGDSAQNRGRDGGQGQGQQHNAQPGQEGQGGNDQNGQPGGPGGEPSEEGLADRQQALRNELNRQRRNLPGQGTEAGDRAAEALGRAEGAMDGAEESLREGDLAEAIDRQSEAMEALREGLRDLGEAMAQQQQQNQGQQGMAQGENPGEQRDPLGRSAGSNGQIGSDEGLLQGEDVYRRARELLDEIRRRTGEGARPDVELDYLERLLDRF